MLSENQGRLATIMALIHAFPFTPCVCDVYAV